MAKRWIAKNTAIAQKVVKVDLKKAFDKMDWQFIIKTL